MGEFASKGVGGTALGFGIGGTALGLLNGGLGGILGGNCGGGLLGGNRNGGNCCEPMETREASCLRQQVATLSAEKYADSVGISTFRAAVEMDNKQSVNIATALAAIADQNVQIAVNAEREKCQQGQIDRIAGVVEKLAEDACASKAGMVALRGDLSLESERRACGDERICAWTEAHFIRGRLVLPSTPLITGFNSGCCPGGGSPVPPVA